MTVVTLVAALIDIIEMSVRAAHGCCVATRQPLRTWRTGMLRSVRGGLTEGAGSGVFFTQGIVHMYQ